MFETSREFTTEQIKRAISGSGKLTGEGSPYVVCGDEFDAHLFHLVEHVKHHFFG